MNISRKILNVTLSCLLALTSASVAADSEPIRIGEYQSLTGASASFGISSTNGSKLALEEINANGGVLGRKIELITEDDRSLPGEPATIVRKLITRDKVVAILGEFASSRALEGAPIAQEFKIPFLSAGATNVKVTQVGDYIFRDCFIDPFQGTVMARFALKRGFKKIAVMTDEKQDYSEGLSKHFIEEYRKGGGEIVREQSYSSGDKDFRAQLTSIKAVAPDAIFLPGYYGEVGLIARQARQLGIKVPFLGGDGWVGSSLIPVAGRALDGSFFSGHCSMENPDPVLQDFAKKYRAKYHSEPDDMAALGYDGMLLMADAIKRAGSTDAEAIRAALASTKDFPGATGKISIDENRNARKAAVIQTVGGGKFKFVETVEP